MLEATLERLGLAPEEVLVWLGPAIGPHAFEVGLEVRDAFTDLHPHAASAFVPGQRPDKLMADIYALARIRLAACGTTLFRSHSLGRLRRHCRIWRWFLHG